MDEFAIDIGDVFYEMDVPDWAIPPLESQIGIYGAEINGVIAQQAGRLGEIVGFHPNEFSFMDENRGEILADVLNDNTDTLNEILDELQAEEFVEDVVGSMFGGLGDLFEAIGDFFLGE